MVTWLHLRECGAQLFFVWWAEEHLLEYEIIDLRQISNNVSEVQFEVGQTVETACEMNEEEESANREMIEIFFMELKYQMVYMLETVCSRGFVLKPTRGKILNQRIYWYFLLWRSGLIKGKSIKVSTANSQIKNSLF